MSFTLTSGKQEREWFNEWFDSPYYHLLYQHRDEEEAKMFIDNLENYFSFKKNEKAMDLACGKGRHSIYLAEKDLDVTGLDLSEKNISHAKRFSRDNLKFVVHDMRRIYSIQEFHYVFNLFTSFGYFDDPKENQHTILAAAAALRTHGCLVIDFLNPQVVLEQLVPADAKMVDDIEFRISRFYEKGYIVKNIHFEDDGQPYFFQERVKAITKDEFLSYFKAAGLQVKEIFGSYTLDQFKPHESQRMIFIAQKTSVNN